MSEKIENLLGEDRTFDPPSSIVENANATQEWFDLANEDRLAYWQKQALERESPGTKNPKRSWTTQMHLSINGLRMVNLTYLTIVLTDI